jgi:CubicO group peptidase (beta-lactamase class C family)
VSEAPACTTQRSVAEMDRATASGLVQRLFGAAQCVASVQGGIFHRGFCGLPQPPTKVPMEHTAVFDLGQLTMPLATAVAAQVLVAHHRLDLNKTVAQLLPEFKAAPFDQITLTMLLDHSSGLPANADLGEALREADRLLAPAARAAGSRRSEPMLRLALRAVPLAHAPGTVAQVSNLGYLLLGWLLEKVVSEPLDVFVHKEIYRPLGLHEELFFVQPRQRTAAKRTFVAGHSVAPEGSQGPGSMVVGTVADAHAAALGGVAGHAGLFGTASAVWRLAQTLLQCHRGEATLFHTGTLKRFWTRSQRFLTTRTLGWDTPTVLNSSAGKRLSRTAVGHVSTQGPSLWIDTQSQTVGVLLFNALPSAPAAAAIKFRARLFELIASHAASGPPPPEGDVAWQHLLTPEE